MKQIFINNEPTPYYIEKNGKLLNKSTGTYLKGSIRDGYRWFDLRLSGKKFAISQHRLVAEYFLDNPDNLPVVHHKDGNRLNNNLNNLEWVSYSENNLMINKHSNITINYPCEYDADEQWKVFRDTIYLISSCGRIKNSVTDSVLCGKINSLGYREYCLRIHHKKQTFLAHRLVYEAFYSEVPKVINHIDGNKLNNRLNNLENVTYAENNWKALYDTKTRSYLKTMQLDKEGNIIQIFENNAEAARAMHVRPQSIYNAIKRGYCSCGYYWKNIKK